jgi:hypothetical protein
VHVPLFARLAPWLLFPLFAIAAFALHELTEAFPQPADFHHYADQRSAFGIPNFADVISNLAILVPAVAGLGLILHNPGGFGNAVERSFAMLFFIALVGVGLGSTSYHLSPDDARLLGDRLPIAIAFTTLIAWLLAERTWLRPAAATMLLPWIAVGPATVLWWYFQNGDLRFYLLLYVFAFTVPPLLMALPSPYSRRRGYWTAYICFALGMACDRLDHQIYTWLAGTVSGHTLKHLMMGLAIAALVSMLERRRLRFR